MKRKLKMKHYEEFKGEIKQVNIELPMLKSQKQMQDHLETRERIENSRQ